MGEIQRTTPDGGELGPPAGNPEMVHECIFRFLSGVMHSADRLQFRGNLRPVPAPIIPASRADDLPRSLGRNVQTRRPSLSISVPSRRRMTPVPLS
jgi:hypothetical protein